MKKIVKQMMALVLALALAITFMPVNVQAASKIKFANSGKVKVVYYKGAKAKKGTFTLETLNTGKEVTLRDGRECFQYICKVKVERPKLSKSDIVKTVKESKKKKGKIADYCTILVDENGNPISDIPVDGYLDYNSSSSSKTLKAKEGRRNYYIYSYRKTTVHVFNVYIPKDRTSGVYMGVAGLKKGQIKKSKMDKFQDGKISYTAAGFGNKKDFTIVGKVN